MLQKTYKTFVTIGCSVSHCHLGNNYLHHMYIMCAIMSNTSSIISKSAGTGNLSFFYQGLSAPLYFLSLGSKINFHGFQLSTLYMYV